MEKMRMWQEENQRDQRGRGDRRKNGKWGESGVLEEREERRREEERRKKDYFSMTQSYYLSLCDILMLESTCTCVRSSSKPNPGRRGERKGDPDAQCF